MGVVRLDITRREPVVRGVQGRGRTGALREDRRGPALHRGPGGPAERADRGPGAGAPQRARTRRVLGRLLSPAAARRRAAPAAPRRAEPRPQDRARHVQQRSALERSGYTGRLRQRVPDAPRLHGGLDRLAARRAAPRRHDGDDGAPGARRLRAGALRVPAERARGRAAAGRPLPHPASGGAASTIRRRSCTCASTPTRPRPRCRARPGASADAQSIALDGGFQPGRDLRLLLPRAGSAGGRPRLHRGAGHRELPALGHRARRGIRARRPSSARTCSASRRAAASCATCSTWASTRTRPGRFVWDAVIPHVAGARRGEFNCRFGQPSLNAVHAVGSLFPFTDERAGRSRHRPARRAAPAPGGAREPAADLHDQHLGRVLARRRLARAHRRRRHARRDPAGPRAPVPLRGQPAHARRAAAARGGSQYRRPGLPPVQRGGLLAAPACRAGQSRPLGERGSRAAAQRGSAPGRRHRGGCRDDPEGLRRRSPARASPTTSSGRSGSTSVPPSSAGIVDPAAQARRALRDVRLRGGRATATSVAGIRPPELRGAAGHLHGLEPAPSGAGRAGRHHGHDGLDAGVRAHRARPGADRRPAPLDRGALRESRGLPRAGARRTRTRWSRRASFSPRTWTRWWSARARSGTSSARAELPLATPLIECHAHVLPDGALARFPDGGDPRYASRLFGLEPARVGA